MPDPMFQLFTRRGDPVEDGCEWMPMFVEVRLATEHWRTAELFRNGQRLPLVEREVGGRMRIGAEWPRAGCGTYELRMSSRGEEHRHRVDVLPMKLRRPSLMRLLADLDGALPASAALALQRTGALSGLKLLPPGETSLNEEVHRLRRAILGTEVRPGVAAILRELASAPHRALQASHSWTAAERARRPHPARLVHALTQGQNLRPDGRPARVWDARAEQTADCYENQLVNSFVLLLERRIRRIEPALRARRRKGAIAEVAGLACTLRTARRQAAFLDEVGEFQGVANRATMVLLKRPAYRATMEWYLEFTRRHTVHLEDRVLDAPMEGIPTLYQTWGTLRVVWAVGEVAGELEYTTRSLSLARRSRDGIIVSLLPGGQPALTLVHPEHGTTVAVWPQPSYRDRGDIRSVTYEQKPDIAVVVQQPGFRPRLYLFDPKYKLEGEALDVAGEGTKPKKVDIDKMHAYRDAIRDSEGRYVVEYAAILYPGPGAEYSFAGVEALQAIPGDTDALDLRLRQIIRTALTPVAPHRVVDDPGRNGE